MVVGGWVVDVIWHAMVAVGNAAADLWSSWAMEFLLGVSFATQLALSLFAGCRWRGVSAAPRWIIWLFYVGADYVATSALARLSVGRVSGERELVAFWAPFFLVHLGGPDSITAYELEDNELSARSVLGLALQVTGALFVVYRSISGRWTLIPAVWLIFLVGLAKYVERTAALRQANLVNLRSTLERQRRRHRAIGCRRRDHQAIHGGDEDLDLVMEAHSLLYICKQSIVDCWVEPGDTGDARTRDPSTVDWGRMYKVIEKELSLMYDLLYTKAAVIHTWHGYCIRALSPVAIAGALLLVELSNRYVHHRQSDVVITRVLVVATFLQETVSVLRALGSSWAGFHLHVRLRTAAGGHCARHEHECLMRLWRRLHRGLGKVKPFPRSWSGKVGQLNMLELVTGAGLAEGQQFSWGNEEKRYSRTLVMKPRVKELVFSEMGLFLVDFVKQQGRAPDTFRPWELIKKPPEFARILVRADRHVRGQQASESKDTGSTMYMRLGEDLILSILSWHIATDVYLTTHSGSGSGSDNDWVSAVRTLSNYMMYLLVVRPEMLPGRVTRCRRFFQLVCESMADIWRRHRPDGDGKSSSSSLCNNFRAAVLRKLVDLESNHRRVSPNYQTGQQRELSRILYDDFSTSYPSISTGNMIIEYATGLVRWLQEVEKHHRGLTARFILQSWTNMLFRVSYHCSSESHAKQLSYGGELASVVWLMAEHAGLSLVSKRIIGDTSEES